MLARVSDGLQNKLGSEQFKQIDISFHLFPEDWDHQSSASLQQSKAVSRPFRPLRFKKIVLEKNNGHRGQCVSVDSWHAVIVADCDSDQTLFQGPVLFRQQRVGQYGVPFTFLKFRSMYFNSDTGVHRKYVTRLITGQPNCKSTDGNGKAVYKITSDARITSVGRFLRRTSLDELPQFFNVLRGEMSLVGPRPAIAYEVEVYQIWHRRRVLEVRPASRGYGRSMDEAG